MLFKETGFAGLLLFEPKVIGDSRGYFFESFNEKTFADYGLNAKFVQDNQSLSAYGVIRGLHFQKPPHAQTKLVRVLAGRILDVVVDLRKDSATYGKHFTIELSGQNKLQMLVPKGFAHGFSVLSESAEVLYKCDTLYNRESEAGIMYNDPELKINWNIPADKAIISEKDLKHPSFKSYKAEFAV